MIKFCWRLTPELRNCYGEDEIALKFLPKSDGYRYEMGNCLFEATFEKILENCKVKNNTCVRLLLHSTLSHEQMWDIFQKIQNVKGSLLLESCSKFFQWLKLEIKPTLSRKWNIIVAVFAWFWAPNNMG